MGDKHCCVNCLYLGYAHIWDEGKKTKFVCLCRPCSIEEINLIDGSTTYVNLKGENSQYKNELCSDYNKDGLCVLFKPKGFWKRILWWVCSQYNKKNINV